jgi:cell division protein FtsI/penicillin-binding protein 2
MKTEKFPSVSAAEAAPARGRIRVVALVLMSVFLGLSARATQLAVSGDPLAKGAGRNGEVIELQRADIVDRNGALLATTLPSYALVAEPANVWDAPATARALAALFPDLDIATLERRLTQKGWRSSISSATCLRISATKCTKKGSPAFRSVTRPRASIRKASWPRMCLAA